MIRALTVFVITFLLAPAALAQYGDAGQMEQQIQREFQRMQSEMQRQGIAIPGNEYDGGFASDDWRGDLKRYHGNKEPSTRDDDRPMFGASCVNRCLSRGGQPDDCNEECGEVHDEGVFYDPGYDPRQLPPANDDNEGGGGQFGSVQYECFRQCRLHGDSFDTCSQMCSR